MSKLWIFSKELGKSVQVQEEALQKIATGGESQVFILKGVKGFKAPVVVKYFCPNGEVPNSSWLAKQRKKMQALRGITGLPPSFVVPFGKVQSGPRFGRKKFIGVVMPYIFGGIELSEFLIADRRKDLDLTMQDIDEIMIQIYESMDALEKKGIIFGDFCARQVVLVRQSSHPRWKVHLVDTVSVGLPSLPCEVWSIETLDPLIAAETAQGLIRNKPVKPENVRYSVARVHFALRLGYDPYEGKYSGSDERAKNVEVRPLLKVSVFGGELTPRGKEATPLGVLPKWLYTHFKDTFADDKRESFPIQQLKATRWIHCQTCGLTHAHGFCPTCVGMVTSKKGSYALSRITLPEGNVQWAAVWQGKPRFIIEREKKIFTDSLEAITPQPLREFKGVVRSKHCVLYVDGGKVYAYINKCTQELGEISLGLDNAPLIAANREYCFFVLDDVLHVQHIGAHRPIGTKRKFTKLWAGERFSLALTIGQELELHSFRGVSQDLRKSALPAGIATNNVFASVSFQKDCGWLMTGGKTSSGFLCLYNGHGNLLSQKQVGKIDPHSILVALESEAPSPPRALLSTGTEVREYAYEAQDIKLVASYPALSPSHRLQHLLPLNGCVKMLGVNIHGAWEFRFQSNQSV